MKKGKIYTFAFVAILLIGSLFPIAQANTNRDNFPRLDTMTEITCNSEADMIIRAKGGVVDSVYDIRSPDHVQELDDLGWSISTNEVYGFHIWNINCRTVTTPESGKNFSYHGRTPNQPVLFPLNLREFRYALHLLIGGKVTDNALSEIFGGTQKRIDTIPAPAAGQWYNSELLPVPLDPEGARDLLYSVGIRNDTGPPGWYNTNPAIGPLGEIRTIWVLGCPEAIESTTAMSMRYLVAWNNFFGRKSDGVSDYFSFDLIPWFDMNKIVFIQRDFDIEAIGWGVGRDPDYLFDFFHSSKDGEDEYNLPGIHNAELDELLYAIKYWMWPNGTYITTMSDMVKIVCDAAEMLYYLTPYMVKYCAVATNAFAHGLKCWEESLGYGSDNWWSYNWIIWQDPTKTSINHANPEPPQKLNPGTASTVYEWHILNRIYDGLWVVEPFDNNDVNWAMSGYTIEPWLEEGYGQKVTVTLRPDIYWHDGDPVTSADIKWNYDFIKQMQFKPYGDRYGDIPLTYWNTTIVDDYHLTIYIKCTDMWTVYTYFANALIFPKKVWEPWWGDSTGAKAWTPWSVDYDDWMWYNYGEVTDTGDLTCLVGTGAWIFHDWDVATGVTLYANRPDVMYIGNPGYWARNWLREDVDFSGRVDTIDIQLVTQDSGAVPGSPNWHCGRCDVTGDGIVDIFDYARVTQKAQAPPSPDFSISASPTSLTIQQGSSDSSIITIASINGFDQLVTLTKAGMPSGVTASLSSQFVAPGPGGSETSTLTVTVDSTATPGSYTLTVTGTSDALIHSVDISLEITQVGEWSFAIITDLHIGRGYKDYKGEDYYLTDRLKDVVQWIKDNSQAKKIKFVAVLGDLTENGKPSEMSKVKDILDVLSSEGIPYFPVIGNHDIKADGDHVFQDNFTDNFFEEQCTMLGADVQWINGRVHKLTAVIQNYAFDYQNKRFIFLDCVDRNNLNFFASATLYDETQTFLTDKLGATVDPVFLFSHHPMVWDAPCFSYTDIQTIGNIIGNGNAQVLGNFAGHIHGYYDPNPYGAYWIPDQDSLKPNPDFRSGNIDYKSSGRDVTPAGISVLGTEALMSASIDPYRSITLGCRNVTRIVRMLQDNTFETYVDHESLALNPHILRAETPPGKVGLHQNGVDFLVYAFTRMFDATHPINYSLYVDGVLRNSTLSSQVERVWFRDQKLTHGTHEVNLTVVGYAPDGHQVVESIKRSLDVGRFLVALKCPADIIVTDPAGRTISKQVNEIPDATYTEVDLDENGDLDKFVEILAPIDGNYVITLNGTDTGAYHMIAEFVTAGGVVGFTATEIPISLSVRHQYTIDWDALSLGEEGVTVEVDSDGNGVPEYTFASDSELTRSEFLDQTGQLGDINADGNVDVLDAVILSAAAGSWKGHPRWNPDADLNDDGFIDIFDAVILSSRAK